VQKQARGRGRPPTEDTLTPGEWSVLHMVRHGLNNRQIARLRRTSVGAIRFHLRNIGAKVGLHDRGALRQWAGLPLRMGLTRMEDAAMTTSQSSAQGQPSAEGLGIQGVGQISIGIHEVDRAVEFYRDTLGLAHLFTFGNFAFFDCGGVRLFLAIAEDGVWKPSSVVYLRVPDIDAAHRTLTARGVAFESAPHLIHRHPDGTEEWMAFFRDPDGNMLGLMAQLVTQGSGAPA
jgi:catechol 2,3-dioxygenase-like lactoylglutathione lyase family enzyme/DNA-binding CsgD family transcriptional regulator